MRGVASTLTALLAAVLLPLAITAVWTAERVTDTDGYVAAVGPLAEDPDVQEALTDRLEQYAADVVGLDQFGQLEQRAARLALRTAVSAVVQSPSFRSVWESANREGHAELLRTLKDDDTAQIRPLDLAVVVDAVLDEIRAQGLPLQDVAPPGLLFTPDHQQLRAAQEGYQLLDASRTWLPIAWVALVVITLVMAERRLRALGILAGAALVSAALVWPVLSALRSSALDSIPQADRDLGGAIWDAVTNSLERGVLVAVIIAGLALIVTAVLEVSSAAGVDRLIRRGRDARANPSQVSANRTSSARWSLLSPGTVRWSRKRIRSSRTPWREACT